MHTPIGPNGFWRSFLRNLPSLALIAFLALPAALKAQLSTEANPDGVSCTITGYGGSGGAVIIPSTINGLTVTSIGDSAFRGCSGLTSVTIPSGVTSIGDSAFFGCSGLTSVTIPSSVTSIADSAFWSCTGLTSVYFEGNAPTANASIFESDASLAVIYYQFGTWGWGTTFAGITAEKIPFAITTNADGVSCAITGYTGSGGAVTIPSTIFGMPVTSIGDFAFNACFSLTSVTIPSSVTSIGIDAFNACFNLTSVTIPNSVTSIGGFAFGLCNGLTAITVDPQNPSYSSVNGVLFDKAQTTLIQYPSGLNGSYIIPSGVTTIGPQAFSGSTKLTVVTIPASVTFIDNKAFIDCTSLTGVFFKGNAPSAMSNVFAGDYNLTAVYYLDGTTGWESSFGGVNAALESTPMSVPVITWAAPAAITYGTALSSAQLNATANVPGTFVYVPAAGTVPSAGAESLSLVFRPTNATDYINAVAARALTVNPAVPVITWAAPAAITYGTALSSSQLNATASVPGTFVYLPGATTVLAASSPTLSVTFTPTDSTDYTSATTTQTVTVTGLPDQAFLQQLFLDVLGRPIDSGALTSFGAALAGGESRAAALGGLLTSTEYTNRQIEPVIRLYYAAFARCPDYAGLQNWSNALQAGHAHIGWHRRPVRQQRRVPSGLWQPEQHQLCATALPQRSWVAKLILPA